VASSLGEEVGVSLDALGRATMSDEESDEDADGEILRKSVPAWRSDELNRFLRDLDKYSGYTPRFGRRKVVDVLVQQEAVLGLPSMCYLNEYQ
jgi:hypothetical protein